MTVEIGGGNLPSPVGIGLTDLPNIGGGAVTPLAPPVPASPSKQLTTVGGRATSEMDGSKDWKAN